MARHTKGRRHTAPRCRTPHEHHTIATSSSNHPPVSLHELLQAAGPLRGLHLRPLLADLQLLGLLCLVFKLRRRSCKLRLEAATIG